MNLLEFYDAMYGILDSIILTFPPRLRKLVYKPYLKAFYSLSDSIASLNEDLRNFKALWKAYERICVSIDQQEREKYWVNIILKEFEHPSMMIGGKAHFLSREKNQGIFPDMLLFEGIEPKLIYTD